MVNSLPKVLLLIALALIAAPSWAQNTKGDKPAQSRESRFSKNDNRFKIVKKRPQTKRLRDKKPSRRRKVEPRQASEKARNVYPQRGRFVNNPSTEPRDHAGPSRRARVTPRSASRSYVVRKSINPVANYPRPKKRGERAVTRDISGRRVRAKNFQSPKPDIVQPRDARALSRSGQDRKPRSQRMRVRPRSASRSYIYNRSINVQANYPRPKRKVEKAHVRDISGRPLRKRNYQSRRQDVIPSSGGRRMSVSGSRRLTRPSPERYGRFRDFQSRQSPGDPGKKKIKPRSVSSARKKVFPQFERFSNRNPRPTERSWSNRVVKQRLRKVQATDRDPKRPGRKIAISPRSASRPFISRRSTNTWAQFPRPKKKGERASTRDLAGNKLRQRNYQTPPREVLKPDYDPYRGRRRIGDRAYRGPAAGGFSTATRGGRPWLRDIAKRRIRGKKDPRFERASSVMPKGYRTATRSPEKRKLFGVLPVRTPRSGAKIGTYSGTMKARRPEKGGGSVSGRLWNNRRTAIPVRTPKYGVDVGAYRGNQRRGKGFVDQGEQYSGSIKARRPLKGGGSVSGRLWNNGRNPIPVRTPKIGTDIARYRGNLPLRKGFTDQGEEFSGSVKAKRPSKGGGSVSGKLWNNRRQAISVRTPKMGADVARYRGNLPLRRGFVDQGEEYAGDIKKRRPLKGGGSVSGKLWNNKGQAIPVRTPGQKTDIARFQGGIKTRRPLKGGGSVSGRHWNNKETPLPVRPPGMNIDIAKFQGSIKAKRKEKGGGSISGKLWNNRETPIAVRTPKMTGDVSKFKGRVLTKVTKGPSKNARKASGFPGRIRQFDQSPGFNDQGEEFTGNIRLSGLRRHYMKNPNQHALALKKQSPSKATFEEGRIQTRVKQYDYTRNKNSSQYALRVREPGKAYAKAADYQGNIKMQKFRLFERNRTLHPDAKFVKINKNNVDKERDVFTNFKLWWARLFRKNETQPEHLKEKNRRPRYDKREVGLWYD